MRMLGCAALAGLACVSAAPASAQLMTTKSLSAGMAMTMAQTAMETCKTNGYKVSVTVVGNNGEVILQVRGDGTGPHTMENSMRKAYTARTTRNASGEMAKRLKANPQLSLVTLPNMSRRRARCRSRSAKMSSARSACPARRAARKTKPAPRRASTKSPTCSSEHPLSLPARTCGERSHGKS